MVSSNIMPGTPKSGWNSNCVKLLKIIEPDLAHEIRAKLFNNTNTNVKKHIKKRIRSIRNQPSLTKCLKIYQCFTPHQTWLEKKISYKTDNALVLFSTWFENTKCTIGSKLFLIRNSVWTFYWPVIGVVSSIIGFINNRQIEITKIWTAVR